MRMVWLSIYRICAITKFMRSRYVLKRRVLEFISVITTQIEKAASRDAIHL